MSHKNIWTRVGSTLSEKMLLFVAGLSASLDQIGKGFSRVDREVLLRRTSAPQMGKGSLDG